MILLINRSSGYVLSFDSIAEAIRHGVNNSGDFYMIRKYWN